MARNIRKYMYMTTLCEFLIRLYLEHKAEQKRELILFVHMFQGLDPVERRS